MKKYVYLDETGLIVGTSDPEFPQKDCPLVEFPNDFDFERQHEYTVTADGAVVYATDILKAAQAQAEQEYWQNIPYDEAVDAEIRKRYSVSQEFAILRQKEEKPEEYAQYYAYCEECKTYVKARKGM